MTVAILVACSDSTADTVAEPEIVDEPTCPSGYGCPLLDHVNPDRDPPGQQPLRLLHGTQPGSARLPKGRRRSHGRRVELIRILLSSTFDERAHSSVG